MTTFDFNDGNGPVPAHQHSNGGGWVADTASVDKTAYVGPYASVYGSAKVSDNARVSGKVTGSTASEIEDSKEPKVRVEKIAHIEIEDGHYDAVIINCVKYVKET